MGRLDFAECNLGMQQLSAVTQQESTNKHLLPRILVDFLSKPSATPISTSASDTAVSPGTTYVHFSRFAVGCRRGLDRHMS